MNKTKKLMLKRHVKTGRMYLCATQRDDYMVYLGSGTRWRNHLKEHGNKIYTLLLAEYPESKKKEFDEYCTWMSKMLNVVKDPNFANLKEESGLEGGMLGYKHTTESRVKISVGNTGKHTGENNPMHGKKHSSKTRANISASMSGEKNHLYGKTGENHPSFGNKHTQETKSKISASKTGKKHSVEARAKMSAAKTGKKLSAETRAKMSASHKKRKSLK